MTEKVLLIALVALCLAVAAGPIGDALKLTETRATCAMGQTTVCVVNKR